MNKANQVAVRYIGREEPFVDRIYSSELTFDPNQTRLVPAELATKFLRHVDCFAVSTDEPEVLAPKDSTEAQLEAAELAKKEADKAENKRQDLVDSINAMNKEGLQTFAKVNYGQNVPKNISVDSMRAKVVGMVDSFGIV